MLADTASRYYTFNDPMDLMLDAIREIAFRASLKAGIENATTTDASQVMAYVGHRTYSIYRTDYLFLGLAVALSLVGVATTAGTFHGWWQLGRNVSMNPFELGKAFRAPLLSDAGSNISPEKFPTHLKERTVRYGVSKTKAVPSCPTMFMHEAEYLVVDDIGEVRSPRSRDSFGM